MSNLNVLFTSDRLERARDVVRAYCSRVFLHNKERQGSVAPLSVEELAALVEVGGNHFEAGLRDFETWAQQIVRVTGEEIRPYLRDAYVALPAEARSRAQSLLSYRRGRLTPSQETAVNTAVSAFDKLEPAVKIRQPKAGKVRALSRLDDRLRAAIALESALASSGLGPENPVRSGLEPEALEAVAYGIGFHIDSGFRRAADVFREVIVDFGDWTQPYLVAAWDKLRKDIIEKAGSTKGEHLVTMTPAEVQSLLVRAQVLVERAAQEDVSNALRQAGQRVTVPQRGGPSHSRSTRPEGTEKDVGELSSVRVASLPAKPSDDLGELFGELDSLIGLARVKAEVRELADYIAVEQLRSHIGLKTSEVSLHVVFHGNPGTGKTTVARLLARIYKTLGIVSKGHLVETDRSGLVAQYVGQTAPKTKDKVEQARGGILFIDEAYSLAPQAPGQDPFGQEAIDTLTKLMEDYRRDLVVIVAGYPEEMGRLLNANPGLQSRFSKVLLFEDYTTLELMQIFELFCREGDYYLTSGSRPKLKRLLESEHYSRGRTFGNARFARNVFDHIVRANHSRVRQLVHPSDRRAYMAIEASDVPEPGEI